MPLTKFRSKRRPRIKTQSISQTQRQSTIHGLPLKSKDTRPIVVHIGNKGINLDVSEKEFEKTKSHVDRFKGLRFVGIDLHNWVTNNGPDKWTQITADAITGLRKLKDDSVGLISSDMTIGYYSKRKTVKTYIEHESVAKKYTDKVFKVAIKKLKQKGVFFVTVDSGKVQSIMRSAVAAGFNPDKITYAKINPSKVRENSFWTARFLFEFPQNIPEKYMVKIRIEK